MSLPGTKRPVRRPRIAAITIHSSPHLAWLTEVTGSKIGRWSVAEVAVKLSESPAFAGGRIDRGAPCYGKDNE